MPKRGEKYFLYFAILLEDLLSSAGWLSFPSIPHSVGGGGAAANIRCFVRLLAASECMLLRNLNGIKIRFDVKLI